MSLSHPSQVSLFAPFCNSKVRTYVPCINDVPIENWIAMCQVELPDGKVLQCGVLQLCLLAYELHVCWIHQRWFQPNNLPITHHTSTYITYKFIEITILLVLTHHQISLNHHEMTINPHEIPSFITRFPYILFPASG